MRLNKRGQFIPITAMVMFTTVVFLVAVVNIFKVAREKLKVQNLADAAALNIASQMASSMNKTADMNAWMNHFVDLGPNVQPTLPGGIPNCIGINPDLPPLACAENATKDKQLNKFTLKGNAAAYAALVQRINQAQQMFIDAYNNFIGAGTGSNSSISSNTSLQSVLIGDIPALAEPGTTIYVWNTESGKPNLTSMQTMVTQNRTQKMSSLNTSGMQPLKYKIHDVVVTYKTVAPIFNTPGSDISKTLGQLLASNNSSVTPVGWMEPDPNQPMIKVGSGKPGSNNSSKFRIGAGAIVIRQIQVPLLGYITMKGQAQAFIVDESGSMGTQSEMKPDPFTGTQRPVFKPTYWVKLVGVK